MDLACAGKLNNGLLHCTSLACTDQAYFANQARWRNTTKHTIGFYATWRGETIRKLLGSQSMFSHAYSPIMKALT